MTELASRAPSRPEFEHPSRGPSRRGVNPPSNSSRTDFPPGLSYLRSTRPIRILELHREEAHSTRHNAELTLRDLGILQELDSHRYLDRDQIQALFFPGPRNCQYRLQWLLEHGLLVRWRAATRPGRICRASIYLLAQRGAARLAEWRDQNPEPFIKRAEHALERRFHLIHQLEANQFFVRLAVASRDSRDRGLYHWVGEHEIVAAYAESDEHGPIPDGWGRLLTPDRELLIHLEWDRGTEQSRRLRAKVQAYVRYFVDRPHASANQVLWVVPTRAREEQLARIVRDVDTNRECCRCWTTTADLLATEGPGARIWSDGTNGARRELASMRGLDRTHRRIEDCIGKPTWWMRRPAGGAGA
ncbi:MAG: replication-relaxation family protein [Candidatus Dormibacteraceae bacterium]